MIKAIIVLIFQVRTSSVFFPPSDGAMASSTTTATTTIKRDDRRMWPTQQQRYIGPAATVTCDLKKFLGIGAVSHKKRKKEIAAVIVGFLNFVIFELRWIHAEH